MTFSDKDVATIRLALITCLSMISEMAKSDDLDMETLKKLEVNNNLFSDLDQKIVKGTLH